MIDIVETISGFDLGVADTVVSKAGNVIATQLGSLSYEPDFGVDLKFFLQDDIQFQNASFKAYLVERLTQHQVNVSNVIEQVESHVQLFSYSVGDTAENHKGLIK
jgi:hypothetical protein